MLKTLLRSSEKPAASTLFTFARQAMLELAGRHAESYRSADPYPHAVIDDFLPQDVAEQLLSLFPAPDSPYWFDWKTRDPVYQPGKQGIGSAERLEGADPFIHHILFAFNSSPFISFLEALTGIEGLIPDPHLHGGGMHQILPGGKLAVHADFNLHEKLKLYRRINVLLYLNQNWQPEYGGNLELWDKEMTRCTREVPPLFNRCVIFNTTGTSYHGHPHPLTCPVGMTRKSIALYYYTRDPVPDDVDAHSTLWQKLP